MTLSLLLTACSSEAPTEHAEKEEYIAVYKEIEPVIVTQASADTEDYYSYLEHIAFTGSGCSVLSENGSFDESRIFDGEDVPHDLPYIYLWTDINSAAENLSPEEYGEEIIGKAEKLREDDPKSMVIVLSPLPVSEDAGINRAEWAEAVQSSIKSLPDRYVIFFDAAACLADSSGYLMPVYDSGDGISINSSGCRKLMSFIEDNRFYNPLAEDGKYRYLYKDIYAKRPEYEVTDGKVAYLTFDDGPSKYTPQILDILAENNIKATFFITGWCISGKEDILERVSEEGHTVGLHSWSHEYDEIYESPDAWIEDFARVYNRVYDITGKKPWAFRFPGGSYNNYNKHSADAIISEMDRRGFAYYDWNCATSDATSSATYSSCINNLMDSVYSDHSVVLMHDSLELTPQYLQDVIDYLREEGYFFETIETADEVRF